MLNDFLLNMRMNIRESKYSNEAKQYLEAQLSKEPQDSKISSSPETPHEGHKKIWLVSTPVHGNLGDHLIALGEFEFLENYFKDYSIIEVPAPYLNVFLKSFKPDENDLVLVQGGGFLGDLWPEEHYKFSSLIHKLENRIIVLPQTFYVSDEKNIDRFQLDFSKSASKNITIMLRDKTSYDFVRNNYSKLVNSELLPDMALYLGDKLSPTTSNNNGKVLALLRTDKEKVSASSEIIESIIDSLEEDGYTVDYSDTVISNDYINLDNRFKLVQAKIDEIKNYDLVITDRLHGMVFSWLAGVKSIATDNISKKVSGVYDLWLHDSPIVKVLSPGNNDYVSLRAYINNNAVRKDSIILENSFDHLASVVRANLE